jgi:hypothetical protein
MQESQLENSSDPELEGQELFLMNRILTFLSQNEGLSEAQKTQQIVEMIREASK